MRGGFSPLVALSAALCITLNNSENVRTNIQQFNLKGLPQRKKAIVSLRLMALAEDITYNVHKLESSPQQHQ